MGSNYSLSKLDSTDIVREDDKRVRSKEFKNFLDQAFEIIRPGNCVAVLTQLQSSNTFRFVNKAKKWSQEKISTEFYRVRLTVLLQHSLSQFLLKIFRLHQILRCITAVLRDQ